MRNIGILVLCCAMAGCSVQRAASDQGIVLEDVRSSKTKSDLLACGLTLLEVQHLPSGKREEIFKGRESKGGCGPVRAIAHGALDVVTLGLWEVVGTPIESEIENNTKWVVVKALYPNRFSDAIEKLDVFVKS